MDAGEIELAFANAMHQFDAGEGNGGTAEPLESEHHVHARFDVAVDPAQIRLFRYFEERKFVRPGSDSSVFISRTAR